MKEVLSDTKNFYDDKDPEINDQLKAILTQYSGIEEDQIVPHVRAVVSASSR